MQEGKGPSPLTAVVARAQAGATEAVEELMREVRVRAVRYVRARLGPFPHTAHAAEDVAQEVCIAVLTSLPRYDERGVPFESFVYSICARKVADLQRALYRGPDLRVDIPDGSDGDADPAVLALRNDEAEKAWALLDRLPEQQREVLTLRVAVGLSTTETADVLDMTAGSVRVSQHRALNRLREILARQEAAG
ncbi:MAG TPA: sigma-70 family RNA polymerase sigma factor [Dermatophilaceae bacterium]|nr:sigma-70 family RNA polymerase sigma factor [Dermatophilaceae bacterium]